MQEGAAPMRHDRPVHFQKKKRVFKEGSSRSWILKEKIRERGRQGESSSAKSLEVKRINVLTKLVCHFS